MRAMTACALLLLTIPAAAAAQTDTDKRISLHVSAGPTMVDAGNSLSAGVGFTPTPRLTLSATVQRDHLNYRSNEFFSFRGGTVTTLAGDVRFNIAPGHRVSPYVFGGMGWGISRPNTAGQFTSRITNRAQTAFAGAGLEVAVAPRISIVGDARFVLVAERTDIGAMIPVRLGVAYRF